ncbi:MAG TPA: hypothetical protein VFL47_17635, partial [Flavisolibacter sp.]|nr:hypothetical protein [Flavisolibacter sp.]
SMFPTPLCSHLVPPISLQVLAENAVKHNQFSAEEPLVLSVTLQDEAIVVHNNQRQKNVSRTSSKIGLNNLNERYKLTTEKGNCR